MHIIMGGTGHVGSSLAEALLKKGEKITIVSRSSTESKEWEKKGATIAVADIYDTAALHEIFKTGKSIFVLNPPADPKTDTTTQEKKTVSSLIEALKYSGAEKLVVESTLGARQGDNIGDLGVLYELEQGIVRLSYPYSIIRPGYYMSNWTAALPIVKEKGEMLSFYPADMRFPMVAPQDIGQLAASLMTGENTPKLNCITGPELYSPNDVAVAFSKALGKEIALKVIPKNEWRTTYESMGFSKKAADSFARMTEVSADEFRTPSDTSDFIKGKTTLQEFVNDAVKKQA